MDKRIEMIKDKFKNTKIKDNFVDYHIENTDKDFESWIDWIWCEENGVNPYECSKCSTKKVKIFCQEKVYHGSYEIMCRNFTNGQRCSYCGNHKVHLFDSLGFLYHDIAKMIVEDERNGLTWEDTYKIAPCSNKKYYIKCDKCNQGSIKPKRLADIQFQSFSCEYCSDGISIPNKILLQIIEQFNLNWECEVTEKIEGKKCRRDGYDREHKVVIEMDGGFGNHTEEYDNERDYRFRTIGEYTLRIDLKDKKEYDKDTFRYIKRQILKSNLPIYLYKIYGKDFNDFNWNEAWKNCQKSLCVEAWELWNQGLAVYQIEEKLKMTRTTVIRYLKDGTKCGKCEYTKKEALSRGCNTEETKKKMSEAKIGKNPPNAKAVICVTTGKIFDTSKEGAEYYNCHQGNIIQCCRGERKSAGKYQGVKLVWRYLV